MFPIVSIICPVCDESSAKFDIPLLCIKSFSCLLNRVLKCIFVLPSSNVLHEFYVSKDFLKANVLILYFIINNLTNFVCSKSLQLHYYLFLNMFVCLVYTSPEYVKVIRILFSSLFSFIINLPLFSTVFPSQVENKGKLILTEIFPSVQKHDI